MIDWTRYGCGQLGKWTGNGHVSGRGYATRTTHSTTQTQREHSSHSQTRGTTNNSTLLYTVAIAVAVVGLSYAAVPLYRLFCQASGYGGTVVVADAGEKVEKMEAVRERELVIR